MPGHVCASHTVHTYTLRHQVTFIHTCVPREATSHLLSDSRLYLAYRHFERPPPVSTPTHAHSRSALNAPPYKDQRANTLYLHTLNHACIATATCVHNTTTHNQHIYIHAFTHVCLFTDSLVRRAGSDLGTWRPGAGKYLVTLPQDHPGASHCHQAIVAWAAPASLELTENRVRRREVFLGRGHVTSRRGGAHHPIGGVRMAPAHCPVGHTTGLHYPGDCHPPVPQSHKATLQGGV